MKQYILAIDQGTTGTTSMVFDRAGAVLSKINQELTQYFPQGGWVEHDPEEIWQSTLATVEKAFGAAGITAEDAEAISIPNPRATSLFWRKGGVEAVRPA